MAYYRSFPIDNGLIQIEDCVGTKMYLVLGEKQAVLLDTGLGAGNLAEYVRTMTDLPLTVVLTHGHVDHAMGTGTFDPEVKIYLHPADNELYTKHAKSDMRMQYYRSTKPLMTRGIKRLLLRFENPEKPDWQPLPPAERFTPLQVGDTFDLGNEVLEICPGEGHTHGTVTVLFQKRRILLLGDAVSRSTYLFLDESLTAREYLRMLQTLKTTVSGRYDRVLTTHGRPGPGLAEKGLIDGAIWLCDAVITGRDRHVPLTRVGMQCYSAKRLGSRPDDIGDHSPANILYNDRTCR